MREYDLSNLLKDIPDEEAIAIAKSYLEKYPRSKLSKPILELLLLKDDKDSFTKWTDRWLKKNLSARTIVPALEVIPEPSILNLSKDYLQKLPPDQTGTILLFFLKNHLNEDTMTIAKNWLDDYIVDTRSAKEIVDIVLKHDPSFSNEENLQILLEHKDKSGTFSCLLRYTDSELVQKYVLAYLDKYPGSIPGLFLLCDLMHYRKVEKAEALMDSWMTSYGNLSNRTGSGLLIELFSTYISTYEDCSYIWNWCKERAGKNVPGKAWIIRFLIILDNTNETLDWILSWLKKNPTHQKSNGLIYELINTGTALKDPRFKALVRIHLENCSPEDEDFIARQLAHLKPELDDELRELASDHLKKSDKSLSNEAKEHDIEFFLKQFQKPCN